MKDDPARFGDTVRIHFKAMLSDGFIVESTIGREPVEFMLGRSGYPMGIEEGVEGMRVGETRVVSVPPEKGHGRWKENLSKVVTLPPGELEKVKVGRMILVNAAEGMKVPALVTEMDGNMVRLDLNHPLADKTLDYEIRLMEIIERAL